VLVGELGWRFPFFLAIVPGLILALVLWIRFEEPVRGQREAEPPPPPGAARRSYVAIATSTPILLISLAAAAAAFSMTGALTFLPSFLQDVHGMTEGEAGVLTGIAFAATMIGQLAGGFSSDGLANRIVGVRPLLVAAAYLLAAPAVFAMAHIEVATLAVAAYAVTQIGRGFGEPNLYGTVMDSVAAHERGTAQGFLLAMTFAGSTAGPFVAGVLQEVVWPSPFHQTAGEVLPRAADLIGRHTIYGSMFHVMAGAAALSAACAAGLFFYLRRRRPA
jgi:predicted MFS family arabinose efflux permease